MILKYLILTSTMLACYGMETAVEVLEAQQFSASVNQSIRQALLARSAVRADDFSADDQDVQELDFFDNFLFNTALEMQRTATQPFPPTVEE